MRIKNINGAELEPCKCGDWLQHWKNFSGQPAGGFCPVAHCMGRAEVAVLAKAHGRFRDQWFVVMLCREHAARTGESLKVADSTKLVPTDPKRTCGK